MHQATEALLSLSVHACAAWRDDGDEMLDAARQATCCTSLLSTSSTSWTKARHGVTCTCSTACSSLACRPSPACAMAWSLLSPPPAALSVLVAAGLQQPQLDVDSGTTDAACACCAPACACCGTCASLHMLLHMLLHVWPHLPFALALVYTPYLPCASGTNCLAPGHPRSLCPLSDSRWRRRARKACTRAGRLWRRGR